MSDRNQLSYIDGLRNISKEVLREGIRLTDEEALLSGNGSGGLVSRKIGEIINLYYDDEVCVVPPRIEQPVSTPEATASAVKEVAVEKKEVTAEKTDSTESVFLTPLDKLVGAEGQNQPIHVGYILQNFPKIIDIILQDCFEQVDQYGVSGLKKTFGKVKRLVAGIRESSQLDHADIHSRYIGELEKELQDIREIDELLKESLAEIKQLSPQKKRKRKLQKGPRNKAARKRLGKIEKELAALVREDDEKTIVIDEDAQTSPHQLEVGLYASLRRFVPIHKYGDKVVYTDDQKRGVLPPDMSNGATGASIPQQIPSPKQKQFIPDRSFEKLNCIPESLRHIAYGIISELGSRVKIVEDGKYQANNGEIIIATGDAQVEQSSDAFVLYFKGKSIQVCESSKKGVVRHSVSIQKGKKIGDFPKKACELFLFLNELLPRLGRNCVDLEHCESILLKQEAGIGKISVDSISQRKSFDRIFTPDVLKSISVVSNNPHYRFGYYSQHIDKLYDLANQYMSDHATKFSIHEYIMQKFGTPITDKYGPLEDGFLKFLITFSLDDWYRGIDFPINRGGWDQRFLSLKNLYYSLSREDDGFQFLTTSGRYNAQKKNKT